ncbi:MAG: hypothetical protein R2856_10540 [Caldilineaceae bacterium]
MSHGVVLGMVQSAPRMNCGGASARTVCAAARASAAAGGDHALAFQAAHEGRPNMSGHVCGAQLAVAQRQAAILATIDVAQ